MTEKTNNIEEAEIQYKQALKNYHKESNRHVFVLEVDATEEQKRMILHTSNLIRIAGNCLIAVMKHNYEQLVRTKRYRNLKSLYKKAKDEDDKKVASGSVSLEKIKAGKFFTLKFDELTGCKGKTYTFELTAEQCEKDAQIIVYAVPGADKEVPLEVKGEKAEGVMVLRTITHRFDIETFVVTAIFILYVILFIRWLSKVFK